MYCFTDDKGKSLNVSSFMSNSVAQSFIRKLFFKHFPGAEGKICPICPGNDIARHPQCFNWLFFEMLFSSRKVRVLLVGDMLRRQEKQLIFSVVGIHNKSQPLRIVLKHSYPTQDLCNLDHVYTTARKLHCGNSALVYLIVQLL